MRALVIDDSTAMRSILRQYMRELKYEVVEARNGLEALKHCEKTPNFDVALVDWNMPVMNGLEFVRAVRARKEYDLTKLMMVTTENDAEHIQLALDAGANEFVMKPFTYEVLEEKITLMNNSM
ncbi:MAG TPA: response regulator [Candidatus Angelobacter sp.]|nr:response regulator [Candidatus Angelobacter sp.]